MEKYQLLESFSVKTQFYVISSYLGNTQNDLATTDYTLAETTVTLVSGTGKQIATTTYYTLGAYAGVYSSSTNTWTDTVKVYNTTTGEWTVTKA